MLQDNLEVNGAHPALQHSFGSFQKLEESESEYDEEQFMNVDEEIINVKTALAIQGKNNTGISALGNITVSLRFGSGTE